MTAATAASARLKDRIALVTGGCSGIGLATVERFVTEGAKVVIADVQDDKGAGLEARFEGQVKSQQTVKESMLGLLDLAP